MTEQDAMNAKTAEIDARHSAVVEDRVRATAALHGASVGKGEDMKLGDSIIVGWLPEPSAPHKVVGIKRAPAPHGRPGQLITYKLEGATKSRHITSRDWVIFA